MTLTKTIFFSVGEPSGDQHAARLITRLLSATGDGPRGDGSCGGYAGQRRLIVRGFGGPEMSEAGCYLDRDLTQHAVVGLLEVLPKLRQFFAFADEAEEVFRGGGIDAVVLVDFPGFNWHIAKRARRYGIPVFYYCPPQLWAWGGWRVKKMKRSVDHVLAVLPIEQTYFQQAGIPTTLVGHPFFDAVAEKRLNPTLMRQLESMESSGRRLVAVLPGSRNHEVHRNWPVMLAAIRRLASKHPDVTFLVAAYRDRQCLWCRDQMTDQDRRLPLQFFVGATSEVIQAARCAMMVSGSVSLELMARRTPAAVIYRVGRLLHQFGKRVVKTGSLTLPNLLHGRTLFPELVSSGRIDTAVDFLDASIDAMLSDDYYFGQLLSELDDVRDRHAQPGATRSAADWLLRRLELAASSETDAGGSLTPPTRVIDSAASPVPHRKAA